MGRVSLTEAYDDRSVIAKLNEMDKRVTENTTVVTSAEASAKASAQAAQETADRFAGSVGAVVQNANAQINASKAQVDQAKAEVDATVTTVAQAVQTANNASASAQQSAQTVAGYDTRLTAVEDADTHNVKLEGDQTITGSKKFTQLITSSSSSWRANWVAPFYSKSMVLKPSDNAVFLVNDVVQDSQANLVSVDQIIHNNANTVYRDWQLQSAHGNVDVTLEINANGEKYATAPTPSSNAPSTAIVNKAYVESTDGVTNNLVHKSADETVNGFKTMNSGIVGRIGRHYRVTAEQKICIADFVYTPSTTGSNIGCKVWLTYHGRYCQFDGWFGFQITPAGEVTNVSKGGISDGSDSFTTVYIYNIPGTYKIRMAIGNARSTNNHMIFNSIGGVIDAGYDLALDYTSTGSFVTNEISGSTASILLIGGA